MVAWLVSEENSYTTGAIFDLSGGRAHLSARVLGAAIQNAER